MEAMHARFRWAEIAEQDVGGVMRRQVITGEGLMVARISINEGHGPPTHSHVSEQITCVLEGALRFWVGEDEEEVDVAAGEAILIAGDIPHRAEALEPTLIFDIFAPPREDLRDREPAPTGETRYAKP